MGLYGIIIGQKHTLASAAVSGLIAGVCTEVFIKMKLAGEVESAGSEGFRLKPRHQRRTLQDSVYDNLREMLMSGIVSPGDRLTVRAVAASMGTSIMPVREAFRRLTSEGALEPLSTGATRVPVFDAAKLHDIIEIRMAVEGLAVRRAATRLTAPELESIALLQRDLQRAVRGKDRRAEAGANERFHFALYQAADSTQLFRVIQSLWLQMGPWIALLIREHKWPERERGTRVFRYHDQILAALRRHDPDAAEAALRADISVAAEVLIAHVRGATGSRR